MKKLTLTLLLLAFFPLAATAQASPIIWDGTVDTTWYTLHKEDTVFIITTPQQLAGLAQLVNDRKSMYRKTIKLGANIMLNNTTDWQDWGTTAPANSWIAIGNGSFNTFDGTFDGAGYVISGVYINTTSDNQGLFGTLSGNATIKNIGVVASYIKGGNDVGGLVGYNWYGTVSDSYSIGTVNGGNFLGGFMGYNYGGTIKNSYSIGDVSGSGGVGGLVGVNWGTVINSYFTGALSGKEGIDGLVEENRVYDTVINNYYDKDINKPTYTGKGKTTAEMKKQSTFVDWDFTNIWGISKDINNGYPHLINNQRR